MMRVDSVFTNLSAYTLWDEQPLTEAIAVHRGRIVALGDDAANLDAANRVDLGGATLVPGFNDVHHHVSHQGERLRLIDASAARSISDVLSLVRRGSADAAGPESWIELTNFDHAHGEGRFPHRSELDEAGGGRPVWIMHASGHLGVASSTALRLGGIDTAAPPSVEGGTVEIGEDGTATGVLMERAMFFATQFLKPRSLETWAECIGIGSDSAISKGVTSATDTGVIGPGLSGNGPMDIGSYQMAREAGRLKVRMTLMPEWTAFSQLGADDQGLSGGMRTGFGDDWIRLGAVKFFADGSLLGQTAAVSEPFLLNGSTGDFVSDPVALRAGMVAAARSGWQLSTHAIGDRAIAFVLDAYEEAVRRSGAVDRRHRIEHTAVCPPEFIDRIVAGGFIPVPQSHFIGVFGDGMWDALGDRRAEWCYRQRSFVDRGVPVPGSSDCPVVDGAPLLGIHDLVNRKTPSGRVLAPAERLTAQQALEAYTVGSAYAQHQERDRGRIAPGYLADFVALSGDLLRVPAEEIGQIEVDLTVIGGEVVFERTAARGGV